MERHREVIIIDDDPIFQMILKFQIGAIAPEVQIREFMNGRQALDHLLAMGLDHVQGLVLMDLNMPVMDGWGLLDSLREELLGIDVLMEIYIISSSIDPSEINRSREYGFVSGFFSKPLDVKVLEQLLTK